MSAPQTIRRLVVQRLTSDFRAATSIQETNLSALRNEMKGDDVLVLNHYVGINASDVNASAGRYDPRMKPPFVVGMESVGTVLEVGKNVKHLSPGMTVACLGSGCFADVSMARSSTVIPLPGPPRKEILGLLVTGLTSSIALDFSGKMTTGETVLVTAAAGGAGQIAVRLAKLAGNTVIGTCSSAEKEALLKKLGCDRVINYKKENFAQVLKKEFPKGIDIIYESVGGEFLKICAANLAKKGRLIIIGSISTYTSQTQQGSNQMSDAFEGTFSTYELLPGSKTVSGFFLPNHASDYPAHLQKLMKLMEKGELIPAIDDKFQGIEQITDAVEYLHAGKNVGKVVVALRTKSQL